MKFILSILISFILISCGGGGSSSSSGSVNPDDGENNTTYLEGVFIDSLVDGINYKTSSISGKTDSDGGFLYKEGESIEFSIGDIKLGEAKGKNLITPKDISEFGETNITSFLISIDDDSNSNNGIQITDAIHAESKEKNIDFSQSEEKFHSSENVNSIVHSLTKQTQAGERGLVSASTAKQHIKKSAQEIIITNLFNLDISKIHSYKNSTPTVGTVNYNYHNYGDTAYHISGHAGIDFVIRPQVGNNSSGNFYSLSDGEVISAGVTGLAPSCSYSDNANVIAIYDNKSKKTVIYLHASSVEVVLGETVTIGTLLGTQGNTGKSTGKHVHVEVRDGKRKCAASGSSSSLEPTQILIDYLKAKKEPEVKSNPVIVSGYVFNEKGQPVNLAKVSTNLDSVTALTDSTGYFNLITRTEGGGNYANTPYAITIKTAKYQGYKKFSSSHIWGDQASGQTFTLVNQESDEGEIDSGRIAYHIDDGILNTTVIFKDQNDGIVNIPNDAYIRIVPRSYADAGNYSMAIICKIQNDGSFEDSCLVYSGQRSDFDNVLANQHETYQVLVFKNHKDPAKLHWECGEDLYKYVDHNAKIWSNIEVTPYDYQDRSREICQ